MRLNGRREQGIALIITLLTMVIVAGIGTLLFARTVNEMRNSRDDAAIVQTLLLARGGANLAGAVLAGPLRDKLDAIIQTRSSTTTCWSFGSGSCSAEQPTASTVASDLTGANSVATTLQAEIDTLLCGQAVTPSGAQGAVTVRVYVTNAACGQALPSGVKLPSGRFVGGSPRPAAQDYAIPFVMISESTLGSYKRNVVLQGEYRFTVGRPTFAQYALFTNLHQTPSGGDIWFTENTLFDGPVHTNEFFRFYRNPWFGGKVTSAGCSQMNWNETECNRYNNRGAEFYGKGFVRANNLNSPTNPSYSNAYGTHAPELTAGVDWYSSFVALPQNALDQEQAAKDGGLYFGGNLDRLKLWAADQNGDPLSGNETAVYQYIESQGCASYRTNGTCRNGQTQRTTYRSGADGALYKQLTDGSWQLERPSFNGVLYVAGKVERFTGPERTNSSKDSAPPALASFAQLTLAADQQVRITGDLKYESPPCSGSPARKADGTVTPATCNNLDTRNVLGVYVQNNNILIGNQNWGDASLNAPDDVTIHGVLMSSTGIVGVEDYDQGSPRGTVNLLGGVIENYYGAFGTFNARSGNMSTGYGRSFTYDQRMYNAVSPPYFPTIGKDGVQDIRLFSFGQREQLY